MGQRKISVLQVGKYYPPVRGGIETHLEMLARGLVRSGEVDLQVIVANEGGRTVSGRPDGVPIQRLGTACKVAGAPVCPRLLGVLRRSQADILHIHCPHPTALMAYLASGFRGRLVITYHSDIVRQRVLGQLIGPIQHAALRRARAIITASPGLARHSPVLARHRARCVTIPFGIHPADFADTDPAEVAAVRARHAADGRPLLLAVGRLVYYKGFEFLLRAMDQIRAPATLLLAGDGRLRASLEALAARLGPERNVELLGDVADLRPYYQACDVFILPSTARSEAFGIVQLEAMACGKPVINTRLPSGVPDVSRDGETGLTVEPRSSEALAGAIDRLLGDTPLRTRLGAAARERVQNHFDAERMVADTLALYRRILHQAPDRAAPVPRRSGKGGTPATTTSSSPAAA